MDGCLIPISTKSLDWLNHAQVTEYGLQWYSGTVYGGYALYVWSGATAGADSHRAVCEVNVLNVKGSSRSHWHVAVVEGCNRVGEGSRY